MYAPKLRTGSQVFLTRMRAVGEVRLRGARIGGNLHLDDFALFAVDLQVDESVFLHKGFRAISKTYAAIRIRGSRKSP